MTNYPSTKESHPNSGYSVQFQKLDIQVLDEEGKPKTPWLGLVVEDATRMIAHHGSGYGEPTAADEARLLAESRSKTLRRTWTISTDNSTAFKAKKTFRRQKSVRKSPAAKNKRRPR